MKIRTAITVNITLIAMITGARSRTHSRVGHSPGSVYRGGSDQEPRHTITARAAPTHDIAVPISTT